MLDVLRFHAHGNVRRTVQDLVPVVDLDSRSSGSSCHSITSSRTSSVIFEIVSWDSSVPGVDSRRWAKSRVFIPGAEADDHLIEACAAAGVLGKSTPPRSRPRRPCALTHPATLQAIQS
jgi:hypothetical protein